MCRTKSQSSRLKLNIGLHVAVASLQTEVVGRRCLGWLFTGRSVQMLFFAVKIQFFLVVPRSRLLSYILLYSINTAIEDRVPALARVETVHIFSIC